MRTIRQLLEARVSEAISRVTGEADPRPHVIHATRPQFGDYQANGVMAIAKQLGRNPRELATEVVDALDAGDLLRHVEVAGPGFINLFLAERMIAERAARTLADPSRLLAPAAEPGTIVVDYSSPNLAKEMHVGHLRGTIIGDCLVRVLEALGHRVIRQNHVGDWGTQFGMLIAQLESVEQQGKARSELADLEHFYRQAKQRFDTDPGFADTAREYVVRLQQGDPACQQMWQRFIDESLRHCEAVYESLGVLLTRDDLRPESFYNSDLPEIVDILDKQGLLTESEGAKCVFLDAFTGKDGNPLPVIVQKRDGGYLYATTDLAALRFRSNQLGADRILYVVDARQSLHFQQVFAVARRAGLVPADCSLEHIAYGTMMGEDGKPFKTRSGDTAKLQQLLDEAASRAYELVCEKNTALDEDEKRDVARTVGVASVKYNDLAKNRNSDYVFDWHSMLSFEGNTAPYLLYAYARIRSILRKHGEDAPLDSAPIELEHAAERALALKILQLSEVVQQVGVDALPNGLCQYLYELASHFMQFYENCPILQAETAERRDSRLALARLTAMTLHRGLGLLGIEPLERM